jgi:hypothetical protein
LQQKVDRNEIESVYCPLNTILIYLVIDVHHKSDKVDEPALIEALREGAIRVAGFDVFEQAC